MRLRARSKAKMVVEDYQKLKKARKRKTPNGSKSLILLSEMPFHRRQLGRSKPTSTSARSSPPTSRAPPSKRLFCQQLQRVAKQQPSHRGNQSLIGHISPRSSPDASPTTSNARKTSPSAIAKSLSPRTSSARSP